MRRKERKYSVRNRLFAVLLIFGVIMLACIGRISYIMIGKGDFYRIKAEKQWTNKTLIKPVRGEIFDRNYNELVTNENNYRIDIDLKTMKEYASDKKKSMDEIEKKISEILGMKKSDVDSIINTKSNYKVLKRNISSAQKDKIKALNINGIIISPDTKRYYVNNGLMLPVLGQTNLDGEGISGVEMSYNDILTGIAGSSTSQVDSKGYDLPYDGVKYKKPVNGKDLVLTMDANLQLFTEKEAEKVLKENSAKSVTITIMNPKNGEILAMVSKMNNKSATLNNAIQSTFEPGSIFKAITSEIALETGTSNADQYFLCNDSILIDGSRIYNWDKASHGMLSFVDILKESNNVGFAQLGIKIGRDNIYNYIKKFKFGQKTGIDLPGEESGIVKTKDSMKDIDVANIAFGQGIALTQVQYMAAFNAIANGGTWIRPHVMKETGHMGKDSNFVEDGKYNNLGSSRIMNEDITRNLRGYLEKVVSEGVGKSAYIKGYGIAGKTGTAQKASPNGGGYMPGKYVSSFVGMAPYNDPKITLIVSIDEPDSSNYYAAQTSAPAAKDLFSYIYNYTSYIKK